MEAYREMTEEMAGLLSAVEQAMDGPSFEGQRAKWSDLTEAADTVEAADALIELSNSEIQAVDVDVDAFMAKPGNGVDLIEAAAAPLEQAEAAETSALRRSDRISAKAAKEAADAIAAKKKAELDAAAQIAIRNEDAQQASPQVDEKNFQLDLATLKVFAQTLIGKDVLEAKLDEIEAVELQKARARGAKNPEHSASRARDQQVRKLFVAQGGDECQAIQHNRGFDCQICGFKIEEGDDAYKPECEHVFPVAQAVFFFDLYRGGKLSPAEEERFKLEYKWSHRICNQVKNKVHFLNGKGPLGSRAWTVEPAKITKYLEELWDTTKYQNPDRSKKDPKYTIPQKVGSGKRAWLTQRTQKMKEQCEAILNHFTSQCSTNQREYVLAKLGQCRAFVSRQMESAPSTPQSPSSSIRSREVEELAPIPSPAPRQMAQKARKKAVPVDKIGPKTRRAQTQNSSQTRRNTKKV